MAKVSPLQSNFGSGEFSPLLYGRVDAERYKSGLAKCENFVPTIQGGLTRRPGTYFVKEVKDSSDFTRLVSFEFSTEQAYVLELGDQYIRFYKDNGNIESSPGVPYEITSPYTSADLPFLKYTQSADVLYLVHPDYAPRRLARFTDANWQLSTIEFKDGPYLTTQNYLADGAPKQNETFQLTSSATTGSATISAGPSRTITGAANNGSGAIRITATGHGYATGDRVRVASIVGTTEANGDWIVDVITDNTFDLRGSTFTNAYVSGGAATPALFYSTDVGLSIRIKAGSTWGYVKVTAFTNSSTVTADVESTLAGTTATSEWRLGVWSSTNGYPSAATFHEDRLAFTGSLSVPQRVDLSVSGSYENFAPTDTAGTVTSSSALSFVLNSNDVNAGRWLSSGEKGLVVGTAGGEWIVRPSSSGEALSATNISAKRATTYGCADIEPVQSGKAVVYVQRAGRKFREMEFNFDVDGFVAPDLTILSEHITAGGVVELALQKEPQNIIWAVRNDGALIGCTYERDQDQVKVGWHRHFIGGVANAAQTNAKVETIAVIPSADGDRDELWMIVQRRINGATKRYVEHLTKLFEDTDEQRDAFFVDCGLTYDDPKTITNVTSANPVVITSNSHGFSNGDRVRISGVAGTTEINGNSYTVAGATTNTFQLSGINGTAFTTYVSGGEVRKLVTSVSGLSHLEGESVSVCADGAALPNVTVSGGAVALPLESATIHIGYGYNSDGQMLRLEAGALDGTALGKTRRTHRVGFLLHRTLGMKLGMTFDSLFEITFRTSADPMTRAPALFSGVLSERLESDYDFENQICFRQSQPLPSTVLAIMPQVVTQDRG